MVGMFVHRTSTPVYVWLVFLLFRSRSLASVHILGALGVQTRDCSVFHSTGRDPITVDLIIRYPPTQSDRDPYEARYRIRGTRSNRALSI
jgi:hypothetical protein